MQICVFADLEMELAIYSETIVSKLKYDSGLSSLPTSLPLYCNHQMCCGFSSFKSLQMILELFFLNYVLLLSPAFQKL